VLNLLRGLNPKYRHLKPTIKAKFPPHTFATARSYLLLEELCEQHDAKEEAGQVLYAGNAASSGSRPSGGHGSGSGGNRNKQRQKKRGSGSGNTSNNNSGGRHIGNSVGVGGAGS
jgi:hypothetical protein